MNVGSYKFTVPLMTQTVEIPVELAYFKLPDAVQERLQSLLNCQDSGEILTQAERKEAERLVELAEYLSLLHLRSKFYCKFFNKLIFSNNLIQSHLI